MLSVSEYNPHLQTGKLRPLMLCLTEVTQEERRLCHTGHKEPSEPALQRCA